MSQKAHKMTTSEYLATLAAQGQYSFTLESFAKTKSLNLAAARAAIRRACASGELAVPYRGFIVIVPPEYRTLGCLPADQFVPQLMAYLNEPYYVGLLSAAQYYGAAHQAPLSFQVVCKKNRKAITCGKIKLEFIANEKIDHAPIQKINTARSVIQVSSPEATAFDLIGYYHRCGGLDHVATVISELAEKLGTQKLMALAVPMPMPWVQRLGYLLNFIGEKKKAAWLAKYIAENDPSVTPLLPGKSQQGSQKDKAFRVAVNTEIEMDI